MNAWRNTFAKGAVTGLARRQFSVAGVRVELRAAADCLDMLSGSYAAYEAGEADPDVILDVELTADFTLGRVRTARHPAFEPRLVGETLHLDRMNAAGSIDLGTWPLRGHFRVGSGPHPLEAVVRVGASLALSRRGALIVHASCVASRAGAHLFAGVSGAGKSTIAALLAEACGSAAEVLSDELVILAPDGNGWRAHVAPFLSKIELPYGISRPLTSINFLEQAPKHQRRPVSRADALRALLRHVLVYARDPETSQAVLSAAAGLVASVPAFELRFARRGDVAEVLGIT